MDKTWILALVVGAMAAATLGCAAAEETGNPSGTLSQELQTELAEYISSWNTHESAVLGTHFNPDADMIMGTSPILSGRPAIIGWWKDYFALQEPERELTIDVLSTRSITKDVAVINVRTTTGGRTDQGTELRPRMARGTWVLVHQDDHWNIASMRGMPTEQDQIIRNGG